jgi:NAD(P)-dependent dehydrogenase (short-subunit alcohol dehydrogenase family)
MNKAHRKLSGRVVVVTGASSGIGRELAFQLASAGCKLVLAARRDQDLQQVAARCRELGGSALVVPTDVVLERDVHDLAAAALAEYGRIDLWVNNAGVTLFARLTDAPFADHRRVIETNLFGPMYGARAVLPVFRRQKRGVLINVGSVLSALGQPYVPSYVISKFALRGLSEALRSELAEEPDIHVCTVFPYAVDTPHFQSGANRMGRQARAMPPMQSPEKVAAAIVALAERPRRELHVPHIAALGLALHWLFPTTTERLLLRSLTRFHFDQQEQPSTSGNLNEPVEENEGAVHGRRPPQLSTPAFALWLTRELITMELASFRRRLRALARPAAAGAMTRGDA